MTVRQYSLCTLFTVLLITGTAPSLLRAQSVKLMFAEGGVFSDKKSVTIAHSSRDGTVPPDTSAVRSANRVYFAFWPNGDWTFEEDDEQRLQRIRLVQNTSTLSPETVNLIGGGEATTAVVSVPKSRIDWLTPVTFQHEVDTSKGLPLKEYYAPGYPPLRQTFESGYRLLSKERPLQAIKALHPFYGDVEPPFSLVAAARAVLDTASTRVLDRARSSFRTLRERLVSNPDAEGLAQLDSFRVRLDSLRATLAPYVDARPGARRDVRNRLKALTNSTDQLYADARSSYRQATLRIFILGKYENPKLRLYLNTLTQMLIDRESAFETEEMRVDSLRPSLLQTPRFAEEHRRLQAEGWEDEFREIVRLVNENIHERQEVFGDKIMESRRLRRPAAPQPYYEIMAAMNAILVGDRIRFLGTWDRALEKTTDLALLNDMQRWRYASRRPPDAVSDRALKLVKEARTSQREGRMGDARDRLQLATREAKGYAPFRYEVGQAKLALGDTSAAQKDFVRARELRPSYAPPAVSSLRILLDQKKYERVLARSDSVLQQQPYWLLYLPKARALVRLQRHDDAIQVLRGRCEPLNDENYAVYALLAEAYAETGAWKLARQTVQQARALSPHRPVFKKIVAEVQTKAKKEDVSLKETESDSVGTDEGQEPVNVGGGAE